MFLPCSIKKAVAHVWDSHVAKGKVFNVTTVQTAICHKSRDK